MNIAQPLGTACSILSNIPTTELSLVWAIIVSVGWWIIPIIIIWTIIEFATWHGSFHFNSENGFSPVFNSFVGAGFFYGFQTLYNFILEFIMGKTAYCATFTVPLFFLIPFISAGLFLHWLGFWPYLRIPRTRFKIKIFKGLINLKTR
jgi:hypothetical protein